MSITRVPGGDGAIFQLRNGNDDTELLESNGNEVSDTLAYIVTPAILRLYVNLESLGAAMDVTATCTPAGPTGPTDSQKLRTVQIEGSKIVAQTSGAAIAGAVDSAIGSALGRSAPPAAGAPLGGMAGLGGPRSQGAAHETTAAGPVSVNVHRNGWNVWGDLRWTDSERKQASGGFDGRQLNGTFGIGRTVAPGVVIGAFGGAENFRYDIANLSGRLEGTGATGGLYLGWRLQPALRFDLAGAYSRVGYDATAGTASGSFTGHRLLLSSGLTGTHGVGGFVVEPSARLFGVWETQRAYTDSLGAAQDANRFSIGRASVGGRILAPTPVGGVTVAPYVGLYGDYRFPSGGALPPAGTEILALPDGWSARAVGGIGINGVGGSSLTLGGEWGGIGTDTRQRSLTLRGSVPF